MFKLFNRAENTENDVQVVDIERAYEKLSDNQKIQEAILHLQRIGTGTLGMDAPLIAAEEAVIKEEIAAAGLQLEVMPSEYDSTIDKSLDNFINLWITDKEAGTEQKAA